MRIFLRSLILGLLCEIVLYSCSADKHTDPVATSKAERIVVPLHPKPTLREDVIQTAVTPNSARTKAPEFIAQSVLAQIGPKPQTFLVPANAASAIVCAEGSMLKFDPGSFVYADDGQPVEGDVAISVTEYLTDASFVLAGLSTTSDKNLLESGGMLYVAASAQDRPCNLSTNSFYEVSLPSVNEEDGMQLFYSDNDGKNWSPANRGAMKDFRTFNTYQPEYINPTNNPRPRKFTYEAEYPGGLKKMYEYLHEKVKIKEEFKDVTLKATCYVNITINDKGKIVKVYTPKQISTYADKDIVAAFKTMQHWEVDIAPGMTKKLLLPVKMNLVRDPSQMTIKEKTLSKPESKRYDAKFESDRYIMTVGQFGWINCDKFVNSEQPRTTVYIPTDSLSDVSMTIVFHSIRSVIGGMRYTSGFYFDNIPAAEKITVVAVRMNELGETELAMKETVVDDDPITDLVFNKVTKDEMIKQFEQLAKIRAPEFAEL